MVKQKTHTEHKARSLQAHASVHSDVSDKVVIIMLIAVVVISLLSLGLYLYTSAEDSSAMVTGQAVVSDIPPQGVITLEIVPPPPAADQYE